MSGEATPRPPASAVCERHGLRFDPATQEGCVLCRRERAGGAAATADRAPRSASAPAGRAWAVAALLWLAAGGTLFVAHRAVLASFAQLALAAEVAFGGGPTAVEAPDAGAATDPLD